MRTSLIIFCLIFLVVGGLLYFVPLQQIKADTTTVGNGNTDTRTSSASVTVPVEWSFASAILGFILFVLGLVIPDPVKRSNPKKDSYNKTVESKEDVEMNNGNKRKVIRERTEKQRTREDEE